MAMVARSDGSAFPKNGADDQVSEGPNWPKVSTANPRPHKTPSLVRMRITCLQRWKTHAAYLCRPKSSRIAVDDEQGAPYQIVRRSADHVPPLIRPGSGAASLAARE